MARIRIGIIDLGEIHKFNGQSIKTDFFILGAPLFPIRSKYTGSDGRSIELKLNGKSVLLGYARIYLALTAMFAIIFQWMGELDNILEDLLNVGNISNGITWVVIIAIVAMWAMSVFILGKLPKSHIKKGVILQASTGVACLPKYLKPNTARWILSKYEKVLIEKNIITDINQLTDLNNLGDDIYSIFVYASYKALFNKDWIEIMDNAWNIIQLKSDSEVS